MDCIFAWGSGSDDILGVKDSCVGHSDNGMSVVCSSCDIILGLVIGIDRIMSRFLLIPFNKPVWYSY